MTVAEVCPADDRRAKIAASVRRLDGIEISRDLALHLVYWLGKYADLAQQRNGCPPEGIEDAQYALAEACAAADNSHRASIEAIPALSVSQSLVTVKDAAAVLGVKPTTVRWHFGRGNLAGRKVGETLMIASDSLEQFRAHRADKRSA